MTEDSVLATLRRVPDRIILATMGRDINVWRPNTCLCGWFVREKLAEMRNVGASRLPNVCTPDGHCVNLDSERGCQELFGGEEEEWKDIFHGVTQQFDFESATDNHNAPQAIIERAFACRVEEAANPRRSASRRVRKF